MSISFARDLSLIWLSLLCLVVLLPPVVLLYFAVRGMNWVQSNTLPLLQRARQGSKLVEDRSKEYAARASAPLIRFNRETIRWRTTAGQLLPKRKKQHL